MKKRLFDLTLVVILLIPIACLVTVCGVLVCLTSRGPMFFCQKRVGQGGRMFTIVKLRTMYLDASLKPCHSIRDPRVTPFGRVLRKTRIDELPQVVNVIRGDMSFVGPRPLTPATLRVCLRKEPRFRERLVAVPGITGLTQIRALCYRYGPRFTLKVDQIYIRRQSLALDLWILGQSFLAPLRHMQRLAT